MTASVHAPNLVSLLRVVAVPGVLDHALELRVRVLGKDGGGLFVEVTCVPVGGRSTGVGVSRAMVGVEEI